MVVDDQDSNANHVTPFPMLFPEQGTTPSPVDDTGADTAPRPPWLFLAGSGTGRRRPHGRRRATTASPAPDAVPGCLAP
ncbi:hypothetical protein GCM10018771_01120 [Streptomyces cellulosae]|nr:hypothetical protein GCM10018771_01120 [Streptomyces cellulosae]